MLSNKLEIFLLTYNREKYLKRTLEQIFSPDSPVKNLKFTILNNCSTDGTDNLINEYRKKFPNLQHIRHSRNIGGNANICRAFELASLPYVWVLCDDDEYNWTHWDEVEKAIVENKDLIVVANYLDPVESDVNLIKQLTFVPAGIYKTEHFSAGMMINAYYNISTMFPQLSMFSYYINNNLDIYICKNWTVKMCINNEDASYTRGIDKVSPHPYMNHNYWQFGFCAAIQLFTNNKLKEKLIDNIDLEGRLGRDSIRHMVNINKYTCGNHAHNIFELFIAMNKRQRYLLIDELFYVHNDKKERKLRKKYLFKVLQSFLFRIYKKNKKIYIIIFDSIKIKIFDSAWKFITSK